MTPGIRLTDNVIVDALLNMNFDRHQLLSHARSFALRARGLRCTSSSDAVTIFFVSTRPGTADARNFCFTIRSSSEWNAITTTRQQGRTTATEESRNISRLFNSSLTWILSA